MKSVRMWSSYEKTNFTYTYVIYLLVIILLNSCEQKNKDYIIDFGKKISSQKQNIIKNDLSQFTSFSRPNLERIRDGFLLDGISGKDISLSLNLPKGKYKLISYLEAGLTDSSYLKMFVNNIPINYNWQSFSPPAEGRTKIQYMYRTINYDLNHNQDSLNISFVGEEDSVRILALAVFPMEAEFKEPPTEIALQLKQFGEIDSEITSDEIRNLKKSTILSVHKPFNQYLKLKLDEFALAIDLFKMMGWEKGNEIYGLSIFDRLNQSVMLLDGIINDPWTEKYFGDRARFTRGRILWWLNKERGGAGEWEIAINDLKYLNKKYPNNELIKMYLGEKIDTPDLYDNIEYSKNAPEWSKLQFEALGRLTEEVKWWVNIRQAENGELGGKIGDDVEILRWWSALAAYGDSTTIRGWKKLGDAVWNDPKVYKGYSKKPIDVEHSAEFIADTFPEMIYFNQNKSARYLQPSANYFKDLWTFKNKYGNRFFKSSWFSSTEVKTDPPRDRDLSMNTRAVKAVRFYAWQSNDREITDALNEWSTSWLNAALSDEKGKPIGLFPASIRGVDEQINGDGENWYDAEMYWDYFDWEENGSVRFYNQLLYSYVTSKNEAFLKPLKITLGLIKKHANKKERIIKGNEAWAINIIINNYRFWNIVVQYRIFTGDKSYDDLIVKYGNPYSKYLITKKNNYLLDGLQNLLNDIRYNTPLRTSEVIHTDRVRTFDIITLKGMLTGNDAYETDSPFLAVTYANTLPGLTMLVEENTLTSLHIKFFSHSEYLQNPKVKVWLLENGNYKLILSHLNGNIIRTNNINITKRGQEIQLQIPPNEEVLFTLRKE